jgi:hypothetical protein
MTTVAQALDRANPVEIADLIRTIGLGSILSALLPRVVARTGLASSATQVHSIPGHISAVADSAGTTNLLIVTGAPGAGEVQVTYDADGLATLVFAAAVTGYQVTQNAVTTSMFDTLAATWTGGI